MLREECERSLKVKMMLIMVKNQQHLCQKLNTEVEMEDFIHVDKGHCCLEAMVDDIISEILMLRNG